MTPVNQGIVQRQDRILTVRSERTPAGHFIRVIGEIDLSVTAVLDQEMRRVEASDAEPIVLDLDELEFLDVAGVRLLLDLEARSKGNGGRLRITRASSPQVRRVLELTGAGHLLHAA